MKAAPGEPALGASGNAPPGRQWKGVGGGISVLLKTVALREAVYASVTKTSSLSPVFGSC